MKKKNKSRKNSEHNLSVRIHEIFSNLKHLNSIYSFQKTHSLALFTATIQLTMGGPLYSFDFFTHAYEKSIGVQKEKHHYIVSLSLHESDEELRLAIESEVAKIKGLTGKDAFLQRDVLHVVTHIQKAFHGRKSAICFDGIHAATEKSDVLQHIGAWLFVRFKNELVRIPIRFFASTKKCRECKSISIEENSKFLDVVFDTQSLPNSRLTSLWIVSGVLEWRKEKDVTVILSVPR